MKMFKNVSLVMGLCLFVVVAALAQEPLSIQIYATDGVRTDTLILGIDASATGHIDAALGEKEQPPVKPTMDTRFVSRTGYDTIGTGLMINYHKLVRATQTDQWRIAFQSDENGHELQFTWASGLGASGGAWLITELNGTILCDMTTRTTYTHHTFDVLQQSVLIVRGDGKGYFTATSESLAYAADQKGKIGKLNKKAAVTSEGTFYFKNEITIPAPKLYVEFSQAVELTALSPFDVATTDPEPKKRTKYTFTFSNPASTVAIGETVTVSGIGNKGKTLYAKKYAFGKLDTLPYPKKGGVWMKPVLYAGIDNFTRLPMPNWVNVLSDMFAVKYPGSATGIIVGMTDTAGYYGTKAPYKGMFKYMFHKKYGDVLKMLYKKDYGVDAPGTAVCLDGFNGKGYVKGVGAIGPDKRTPNKLLAELLALKVNLEVSDAGFMGNNNKGFGRLLYAKQLTDPAWVNAIPIDSIIKIADHYISCDSADRKPIGIPLATGQQLLGIVSKINSAFSGKFDTTSWITAFVLKPAKYLYQTNVVYRPTWAELAPSSGFGNYVYEANPVKFKLDQNYPNPFNPSTIISFELDQDAVVSLKIFNMLGQEVATLANNEEFNAGTNDIEFNASNLASGVYYYQLIVNDGQFQQVKKMMLLK